MLASICQSTVLQILRLWSSAWDAMYFPTGSQVSPFTKPVCPRRHVTISRKTSLMNWWGLSFCMKTERVSQRKSVWCNLPGNLRAFQMTMVLSTLQEANQTSWGDHDTSITSVNNKKTSVTSLFFYTCSFFVDILPPVWFLRIVTHLHCSTLASLLLDPNTVLGPINLQSRVKFYWIKCFASMWHWIWFTVNLQYGN